MFCKNKPMEEGGLMYRFILWYKKQDQVGSSEHLNCHLQWPNVDEKAGFRIQRHSNLISLPHPPLYWLMLLIKFYLQLLSKWADRKNILKYIELKFYPSFAISCGIISFYSISPRLQPWRTPLPINWFLII